MKKKSVLQAALVLALVALLMTACGGGGGGGGSGPGTGTLEAPKPGDLPAFPEGSTPATSEAGALDVLEAIKASNAFNMLNGDVEAAKKAAWQAAEGSEGSASGEKTVGSVKASVKGTRESGEPNWMKYITGEETPSGPVTIKVGDKFFENTSEDETVTVTKAITDGGVTIVTGSKTVTSNLVDMSSQITKGVTATNPEDLVALRAKASYKENYSEATSATINTAKGAVKIGLLFTGTASDSKTDLTFMEMEELEDYEPPESIQKIGGSLKVYGADDKELYSKPISSMKDYETLLGELGVSLGGGQE